MAISLRSCENEMVRKIWESLLRVAFYEFYLLEICTGRRFARRTGSQFACIFFFVKSQCELTDAMAMSLPSCENEMVRTGHSRYEKVSDVCVAFWRVLLAKKCLQIDFRCGVQTVFRRISFFRQITMWTYRCHSDEFAIVREWDGTHGPFQIWESPHTGQFIDIPQRNQCVGTSHSKIFACGIKFDTNAICWVCL